MEIQFKKWICDLKFASYFNENIAIKLLDTETGEPIAICTINLPELRTDELAIKDYSENNGMYQTLLDYKIIKPAHRFTKSGFIDNIPVCYLNMEAGSYD